jgi:heme-degrading monooxygenase HmoA
MVIVVFRTHVKPQADLGKLNALSQEMVALVSKMPGFLSIKDFSAQDGEFLVIAEFDSLESVDAWKAHPEHLVAQRHSRIRTIGNLDWTAARPNQGVQAQLTPSFASSGRRFYPRAARLYTSFKTSIGSITPRDPGRRASVVSLN